jgi:DNA polymerase-4
MSAPILYVDVPSFYAEVERTARPELAGRPVVVGGDPRKRGLVQAATPDALEAGVAIGMPIELALARCPRARALRTDMPRYREAEKRFRGCVARVTDRIEPVPLGAAFVDLRELAAPAADVARGLRDTVRRELGLPLRAGAAPLKFVAKLAAEESGAGGFLAVDAGAVAGFLAGLSVARLPGVGPNTTAKLAELSIRTVGDLVAAPRALVEARFGNRGLELIAAGLGRGDDRVRIASHPRTLSQEATLAAGEIDRAVLAEQLRLLAERLERALALEGVVARRLVLKARYVDGDTATRSESFEHGLATAAELQEQARRLLARTQAGERPIRLLGLAATSLARPRAAPAQVQLDLFER